MVGTRVHMLPHGSSLHQGNGQQTHLDQEILRLWMQRKPEVGFTSERCTSLSGTQPTGEGKPAGKDTRGPQVVLQQPWKDGKKTKKEAVGLLSSGVGFTPWEAAAAGHSFWTEVKHSLCGLLAQWDLGYRRVDTRVAMQGWNDTKWNGKSRKRLLSLEQPKYNYF